MAVFLEMLTGPNKGTRVSLKSPGQYIIGAAPSAEIRITRDIDRYISMQHALISVASRDVAIRSLAPSNPLRVNGQAMRGGPLADSDVVQVGFTQLRVRMLVAICYLCGVTDDALAIAAESDGRFLELSDVAIYAHPHCAVADPLVFPRVIAGLDVLRKLGEGSFGIVWLVYDRDTCRVWAMKQMRPNADPGFAKRFRREGRFLFESMHPHIVRCVDVRESDDGGVCLVCQFVAGRDLAAFLKDQPRPSATWTIDVMVHVLEALEYLHTRRGVIVHRDIKPANILLGHSASPGTAPVAIVADLGIARALQGPGSTRITDPGAIVGTPAFIAPEVWSGEPYESVADVYSVGITAYYTLTGRFPYDFPANVSAVGLLNHVLTNHPFSLRRHLPNAPDALVAAVDRACRTNPTQRFHTALAFVSALANARKTMADESR